MNAPPQTAAEKIKALIQATQVDRRSYRATGRAIEAAACWVREVALKDALACLGEDPPPTTFREDS